GARRRLPEGRPLGRHGPEQHDDRNAAGPRLEATLPHRRRLPEQRHPRPERPTRGPGSARSRPVSMRRALREHSRDALAIVGLILAAVFGTTVILINQRTSLPSWVPLIGSDRFALEADFSTAQAVTPGQGQSVDIAGIRVGDVTGVRLDNGHAVVSMEVDNKYAPLIHRDASPPLRSNTGLNDMLV